jgi:hypothetical protein
MKNNLKGAVLSFLKEFAPKVAAQAVSSLISSFSIETVEVENLPKEEKLKDAEKKQLQNLKQKVHDLNEEIDKLENKLTRRGWWTIPLLFLFFGGGYIFPRSQPPRAAEIKINEEAKITLEEGKDITVTLKNGNKIKVKVKNP